MHLQQCLDGLLPLGGGTFGPQAVRRGCTGHAQYRRSRYVPYQPGARVSDRTECARLQRRSAATTGAEFVPRLVPAAKPQARNLRNVSSVMALTGHAPVGDGIRPSLRNRLPFSLAVVTLVLLAC